MTLFCWRPALAGALCMAAATAAIGGSAGGVATPAAGARTAAALAATSHEPANAAAGGATWRGRPLSDWAVRWYHWFEAIPIGVVPHGDPSGANCGIGQDGPVWFLSGALGGTFVNACTVPAGKAIVSPVFNVIDDYPCPAPFNFEPPPGVGLEAFLTADIAQYVNIAYATATLDGVPLRVRRVRTPLFGFTAAASQVANDPCITGSPQLAVSEGHYVFIEPPSPGRHVLQLRSGASVFGGPTDLTINLTVK